MTINWTRVPEKRGFYIWANRQSPLVNAKIVWIEDPEDNLPQSEEDIIANGADWYLGPIQGYPTENFGAFEA